MITETTPLTERIRTGVQKALRKLAEERAAKGETKAKIGRNDTMGTREYLLDKAKNKGLERGRLEGRPEPSYPLRWCSIAVLD